MENYSAVSQATCAHFGFTADPARTADAASILRPLGSHNWKYDPAPLVEAINAPPPISYSEFAARVGAVAPEPTKTRSVKTPSVNDDLLVPKHYEASNPEKCLAHCQQLAKFRDEAKTLPEPLWYAGLQCLHFCAGGDEKIHEWSKPYAGYSEAETNNKIRQISGLGPTTCATFEQRNPGGCDGCPHRGKITSPIILGVSYPEITEAPELTEDDTIVGASGDAVDFIPPPKPFKRTTGGVFFTDKQDVEILVHEYDIFVTDIAHDTFAGYEVATVKHFLPNDGWHRFRFRSSNVASDSDFEKSFRDNHVKPHRAALLRQYISHYLQAIQRARKMAKLYGSMGWKDGTSEFVLGTKVFRADGTIEAAGLSEAASGSIRGFGSKGDLAPWVEQTKMFDQEGMEAHAFSACVWTGAPLMKFTGLQAALFALVGRTNSGKSSMADFCLSAYGDYKKLQMREDDTETVKDTRMGVFGSLPVYIDESTNKDAKALSSFVYQVTQGRSKGRGRIDGSERPTNEWNTIVMASSNSSLSARLGVGKANPHAERVRLYEYHVQPNAYFNRAVSTKLHECITDNYGLAGERYIEYLVTHQADVAAGLKRTIATLDRLTAAPDEERYISTSVGCVLYGARLAQKLGLLDFDVDRLWGWAINNIKMGRIARVEEYTDAIEILGRYMNEFAHERIVVRDQHINGDGVMPIQVEPRGELHQRYELGSQILYIEVRHFRNWLIAIHEDYASTREHLQDRGILVGTGRKALAIGTGLGSIPVDCMKIDMTAPGLGTAGATLAAGGKIPPKQVSEGSLRQV